MSGRVFAGVGSGSRARGPRGRAVGGREVGGVFGVAHAKTLPGRGGEPSPSRCWTCLPCERRLRARGDRFGSGISDFRSVLAPSGGRPRIICLTSNDYCPDPRSLVARTPVLNLLLLTSIRFVSFIHSKLAPARGVFSRFTWLEPVAVPGALEAF